MDKEYIISIESDDVATVLRELAMQSYGGLLMTIEAFYLVTTNDPFIVELAKRMGGTVLVEPHPASESEPVFVTGTLLPLLNADPPAPFVQAVEPPQNGKPKKRPMRIWEVQDQNGQGVFSLTQEEMDTYMKDGTLKEGTIVKHFRKGHFMVARVDDSLVLSSMEDDDGQLEKAGKAST